MRTTQRIFRYHGRIVRLCYILKRGAEEGFELHSEVQSSHQEDVEDCLLSINLFLTIEGGQKVRPRSTSFGEMGKP